MIFVMNIIIGNKCIFLLDIFNLCSKIEYNIDTQIENIWTEVIE